MKENYKDKESKWKWKWKQRKFTRDENEKIQRGDYFILFILNSIFEYFYFL